MVDDDDDESVDIPVDNEESDERTSRERLLLDKDDEEGKWW